MIGAFRELGEIERRARTQPLLAGEISHALVVTLVGVAIAVPAIFFFTFFKNRLTDISVNVSNLADDLLTQMYHNSKKATGARLRAPNLRRAVTSTVHSDATSGEGGFGDVGFRRQ